ncbi:glycosyltransferase family 4 protein [Helicobacter cetorum]|uniref:Group 1 glycosyl transferase n=1 Tax=Helicobacter cetorum (strain ATCC BAA-429 / MIT 00-7128) TaxID=182217 RepID=I0EMN0_HELC0|nr:glycosyltransferase family 1 protein [Helicobacter cetorum]AFI04199.1 group 1 glycosyl transferase [Helicobacter cetorum MIT 00-7128]
MVLLESNVLKRALTGIEYYTYVLGSFLQKESELDMHFYYNLSPKQSIISKDMLTKDSFEYSENKIPKISSANHHSQSFKSKIKNVIKKYPHLHKNATRLYKEYLSLKYQNSNIELSKGKMIDLFICPQPYTYTGVIATKGLRAKKRLACIHDLHHLHDYETMLDTHMKSVCKDIDSVLLSTNHMKSFDEIVCFSHYVKREIINYLGFKENQVHVIYHGVREIFKNPPLLETTCFDLPKNFILVVGYKSFRRNTKRLIQAFEKLPHSIKSSTKIVLTGTHSMQNDELALFLEKDFIINLGYVNDDELRYLYSKATLLWWGTLEEGFGYPMIEAFACNLPVLSSCTSCMPEIGGNAAYYCNPYDVEDIKNALEELLEDETLRESYAIKGAKRALLFTEEKSLQKHLALIKRMVSEARAM